jgi:queuine/archaeosine tRNA-ribosyltransferase
MVQGGMFEQLRDESLAGLEQIDFPARVGAVVASRRKT